MRLIPVTSPTSNGTSLGPSCPSWRAERTAEGARGGEPCCVQWHSVDLEDRRSVGRPAYLDGQQAVLYRSKMNPFLGRNFEALDPLEWLARMSDHIVRPWTAPDAVLRR